MHCPAIPNYHDRSTQVAQQEAQELYDLNAGDVLAMKPHV